MGASIRASEATDMHPARLLFLASILVSGVFAFADDGQAFADGQQDVITGPYGVPRMVLDDTDTWQEPIEVFADAKMRVFIPDITGPSWAAWHVKKVGTRDFAYFLDVYTYRPDKRATAVELIYVDTSKPNQVVSQNLLNRIVIDTSKNPSLAKIVAKITALVRPEAEREPAEVAQLQSSIRQEKQAVARMLLCADPDNTNPDCNLNDSDFRKKYPANPRPAPQLIPGAVPGVNCGVGTDKSCCCADGAPTGASENGNSVGPEGVYKIGGNISAPVPILTPVAEYSPEARRAKYGGECLIAVIVNAEGNTQDLKVVRGGLKYGMDEKALEAVRKYKFRPAMKDGRTPVPVMITVAVNFKLY
jgi:TonB family protein